MNDSSKHEFLININDEGSGLRAYVAIHSSKLGPAHGGTRMKKYKNDGEAIRDALSLSKAMSYKSALASLPYGGAKAVIMLPEKSHDRNKLLRAYADKIDKMQGLFHTGTDVGLTDKDVIYMSRYCKYFLGLPKVDNTETTSKSAAKGVYYAIKSAAKHKYKSDNLQNLVIGIKGLGKLGSELGRMLYGEGANLLVADINPEAVKMFLSKYPNTKTIDHTIINTQKMDIYSPCALGEEFSKNNIHKLNCGIIAGGANNQLTSPEIGDMIYKQSIVYVPDYIANAGGLIFVCEDLEKDGFNQGRLDKRLARIADTVNSLLIESSNKKVAPHRIADIIAKRRIDRGLL